MKEAGSKIRLESREFGEPIRRVVRSTNRTISRSFRISQEALDIVATEANSQNLSLNNLVNKLVVDYAEFGRFAQCFDSLKLSRRTFAKIVSEVPEVNMIEVAQDSGQSEIPALISAKYGNVTVGNAINFMRDLSMYGNLFRYHEAKEHAGRQLLLIHDLGSKWSVFLANYLIAGFATASINPRVRTTERTVMFSF